MQNFNAAKSLNDSVFYHRDSRGCMLRESSAMAPTEAPCLVGYMYSLSISGRVLKQTSFRFRGQN
jgi:hypothetical protein